MGEERQHYSSRLLEIISNTICFLNIHFYEYKWYETEMYNTKVDIYERVCLHCNKKQRMSLTPKKNYWINIK